MSDRTNDQRQVIHLGAVALVNRHGAAAVTPDLLQDSLGHDATDPSTVISSVDEVFSSLMSDVGRVHSDSVTATISRRRSLTDSLQHAFSAYWDTVVAHRDVHLAVRSIQGRRLDTRDGTTDVDPMRFSAQSGVSTWLDLIADAHHIRWELPTDRLALLVSATLDGLTTHYLVSGDPQPARDVLQVLAYQVAQYGRRPGKNQQR